ncbi:MAG: lipopolysaccharide biosynthesis protein [Acidimicrobiales bacterium]
MAPEIDVIHTRRSLNRGAIALLANGGVNAVLGVAYWLVAAHLFPTSVVGKNSAVISAMLTISGLAQCNFARSLSGLLPKAGTLAGRLLGRVYLLTGAIGLALGVGFAIVVPFVSTHMRYVRSAALFVPGFALAVGVWTVFTLEDTALASVRSAHIVPIENAVFGVFKIGLLVLLRALHVGLFAIFASWVMPLILIVLPINWYLFRRALPRAASFAAPHKPVGGRVATWVVYDFVGYLLWLLGTLPLTFLVLARLGSEKAAAFYIPFTIVLSVDLLSLNVGNAFTAELQRRGSELDRHSFAFMAKLWSLVAAVSLFLIVAAPVVLELFGSHYRTSGHLVLVILAAAALPRSVMFFSIAAARAQARGKLILLLQAIAAVGTLVLGLVLMSFVALEGMAVAWLAASLVSAMIAAVGLTRARRPAAEPA